MFLQTCRKSSCSCFIRKCVSGTPVSIYSALQLVASGAPVSLPLASLVPGFLLDWEQG